MFAGCKYLVPFLGIPEMFMREEKSEQATEAFKAQYSDFIVCLFVLSSKSTSRGTTNSNLKSRLLSSLLLSYCWYYCVHLHLLIFCQAFHKRALLFFNHQPTSLASRLHRMAFLNTAPPTRGACVMKSGLLAKYYFTCVVRYKTNVLWLT